MARKKSPALRSVGDALTSPQTRQERYLANIAGLVATKPEYPFTRLERYLDAIAQSTGGSAETIEELKRDKLNVYGRGVNLLDSWYLIGGGSQQGGGQFPINQREQTSYIGNGYGIDRWFSTNTHLTVTLLADGIQLASDGGGNAFLRQNVRNINATDSYTLSMLAQGVGSGRLRFDKNDPTEATGIEARFDSSDGTNPFLVTCTGVIGANNFAVPTIRIDSGKSIKVLAAKMELGGQQTLAHQDAGGNWVLNDPPPNFQQELAKCQRYFQVFRTQALRPTYGIDFRPPMATDEPALGSFVKDTVTYYTASSET